MIDVNTFVGEYPWRPLPGTTPEALLAAMDRTGIATAWTSYLPSLFWKDPAEGNSLLYGVVAKRPRLRAVPVIHPGLPGWEDDLRQAVDRGAVALRADPGHLGIAPAGAEMLRLVAASAASGLPLLAAVRLEDGRGRHPLDVAPDLAPSAVRAWVRHDEGARIVITHAERSFIEEVHFGSTPEEASRIWWDIAWIWGPPEDHLALLLATMGRSRFLFGSGQPLRIPETPAARLDLLPLSSADRQAIESGNAQQLSRGSDTTA